jgi:hypothetical protein
MTKEEVIAWCEVRSGSQVWDPLDLFARKHLVDRLALSGRALSRWMQKHFNDFLRECKVISSNKLDRTVSQKNAE